MKITMGTKTEKLIFLGLIFLNMVWIGHSIASADRVFPEFVNTEGVFMMRPSLNRTAYFHPDQQPTYEYEGIPKDMDATISYLMTSKDNRIQEIYEMPNMTVGGLITIFENYVPEKYNNTWLIYAKFNHTTKIWR